MNRSKVWTIVLLCAACLIIGLHAPCRAQNMLQTTPKMDLAAHVSLPPGPITLGKALGILSKAAGGTIKAEPTIEQHPLVVAMEGVTVKSALEAIIDLNQWRWIDTPDGDIIVARPRVQRPQQLEEIIPAFHAILPPALKRFLGIHVETGSQPTKSADLNGKLSSFGLQQVADTEETTHCLCEYAMNDPRLLEVWPQLPESVQNGAHYSFNKWSDDDLQRVLRTLLGFTLGEMYTSGNMSSVLQNHLYHCQVNPGSAALLIGRERYGEPGNFGVYYVDPQVPSGFMVEFATNLHFIQGKMMPIEAQELHP